MSRAPLIPKVGAWLIDLLLPSHQSDLVLGDFEEYLASLVLDGKGANVKRAFWMQLRCHSRL